MEIEDYKDVYLSDFYVDTTKRSSTKEVSLYYLDVCAENHAHVLHGFLRRRRPVPEGCVIQGMPAMHTGVDLCEFSLHIVKNVLFFIG